MIKTIHQTISDIDPPGWRSVKLGEVAEVIMGQSPDGMSYNTEGNGFPLLNGPTEFGKVSPTPVQWTTLPTRFAEVGDILLCVRGATTGRKNIANTRYCIGRGIAAIRGKSKLATTEFLWFVLDHVTTIILSQTSGSTFPNLPGDKLNNILIPLPPLDEQRRIAAILAEQMAEVERARAAAEAEIEAAQQLQKKCLHREMNRAKTKDWKSIRIEKICSLVRGSSPRPKDDPQYYGGKYPRLMVADITRDGMYVTPKIDSLTEEGAKQSRFMKVGSVVMVVSGAAGLPAILSTDAYIHDGFVGFRDLASNIDALFFVYWLMQRRAASTLEAAGAIWQNLTTDQIKAWEIPLPSLDEQHRIAAILTEQITQVEQIQSTLETKLEGINQLPAALLRKAFNGEL